MKDLRRHIFYSILLGLFFGNALYFGARLADATINFKDYHFEVIDILFSFVLSFIFTIIFYFALKIDIKEKAKNELKIKRWHIFAPLMLASLVMLITMYPGHHPADAHTMLELFKANEYWSHFPPFVCMIIGIFFSFGEAIGHVNIGFALMMFLQTIIVNIALTEAIFYCSKKLKNKLYPILIIIFFITHPLVQTLLIRAGQDTIFGGILLLIGTKLLKISEDENYFDKKRRIVFFAILCFLLCITRNNGVYVLIVVALTSLFVVKNKKLKRRFLIAILTPFLAYFSFQNFYISSIVKHQDSFFQETINIPILQIARSMYYNPDEQSLKELEYYFEQEKCMTWLGREWKWSDYNHSAGISDPYKDCMYSRNIEEDPLKFFALWAKIGSQNIDHYIAAPAVFGLSLYYPYVDYYQHPKELTYQWHRYVDSYYSTYDYDGLHTTKFVTPLKTFLDSFITEQNWSRTPVLHQLWRATFTTYLLIITIVFVFYKRNYKYLLPLSLVFGLMLTVALAPIVLFRYIFPAVLCTPIMIYILIKTMRKDV